MLLKKLIRPNWRAWFIEVSRQVLKAKNVSIRPHIISIIHIYIKTHLKNRWYPNLLLTSLWLPTLSALNAATSTLSLPLNRTLTTSHANLAAQSYASVLMEKQTRKTQTCRRKAAHCREKFSCCCAADTLKFKTEPVASVLLEHCRQAQRWRDV